MPAHGFEYPMKIHVDLFQEGASYHTARKRQFFGFKLAFHTLRPWGLKERSNVVPKIITCPRYNLV